MEQVPWNNKEMICAFDIGIKNFAFAAKDTKLDTYHTLCTTSLYGSSDGLGNNLSKTELSALKKQDLLDLANSFQRLSTKAISKNILKKDIVDIVYKARKKVKIDLVDALIKVLDEHYKVWSQCEVFLVERQMTVNRQALKLGHFLEAYLRIKFPNKKVINYSASNKTKKLGGAGLKRKVDRKKWTIKFAESTLTGKDLEYYLSLSKKDDVADVVCMIESFMKAPEARRAPPSVSRRNSSSSP